jgi:hypothetical protein
MCKRNARQTPEEPPVRCHHWTPYSIPLHTALRRFANPFRVASFGRADLTKFPWISPVTCEGDTALLLASCKRVYFLSDLTIRAAHSIVIASTSHTGRLIAGSLGTLGASLREPSTAHQ